jgi:hypothetical protein
MDLIMKKYEYDKLTVTAQSYDRKVSVEFPQDLDMMELLDDVFKPLAIGLSFSEDTWKACVIALADQYMQETAVKSDIIAL